jgi:hypothetical protein
MRGTTSTSQGAFLCENARVKLEVECYSGRKADERPVRFRLEGHEYLVEELLDQWYGQDDEFFKLRADDGNLYIVRHATSTPEGGWHLVSFRQAS